MKRWFFSCFPPEDLCMILVGLTFLGFFPLRCLKMFKDTLRVIIRFLLWRLISAASDLKVTELEASKHIVLRLVLDSHHFVVFSVSLLCRHAAGGRGQLLGCFRLLIMYIEQREAGRRIFIPSFVLGVHAILVLLKHTERDNHGGQFQRFANRITGRGLSPVLWVWLRLNPVDECLWCWGELNESFYLCCWFQNITNKNLYTLSSLCLSPHWASQSYFVLDDARKALINVSVVSFFLRTVPWLNRNCKKTKTNQQQN